MKIYIDHLLSYKNDEYNRANKNENIDKKSTEKYLDSCVFFIYDNKTNYIPFLKEIENFSSLGEEIKRIPEKNNKDWKQYILKINITILKKTIYLLLKLLKDLEIEIEIKKTNKKYEDIAIRLDLTESEEISIFNEFFFSFLITRFYKNDENIF